MSFGFIASARAIATRCCWPPESCAGIFFACWATPTRSSSAIALRSASLRFFILRTLIGPSVTFSRIVRCAKRLNDWKTMPTSARSVASALPSFGSSLPSIAIVPRVIVSSRLIVRHSVDLPEPDGPITTTTSPRLTTVLMSFSTWKSPKCFSTSVDDDERLTPPDVDVRRRRRAG